MCGMVLFGAAACASTEPASQPTPSTVPETVEIGPMPQPLSESPGVPSSEVTIAQPTATTTVPAPEPLEGPIADAVTGSRLLMIGDEVLASTAPRFDGIACDVLPSFGWTVELATEPGRFVDFGAEVLDERLDPDAGTDWDAVAVMLGHQYDGSLDAYIDELDELVLRVAPRPVLAYTVADVDGSRTEVNDAIRELPSRHANVLVVDWAEIVADEPDELLVDGGPRPSEEGSGRLVLFTAAALGEAPLGIDGQCLEPVFADDSAILI